MQQGETYYEAWERFKELLLQCPHHGQSKLVLLQIFYQGVDDATRLLIETSSNGSCMDLPIDDEWALIEKTALHAQRYSSSRPSPSLAKKSGGIYEVDADMHRGIQNSALAHEVAQFRKQMESMNSPKQVGM